MDSDNGVATKLHGNHSGHWGLASLLMGGLVIILFPMIVALMLAVIIAMVEDNANTSRDVDLGVNAAHVVVLGLFGIAVFAVLCGLFGLATSLFRWQPFGLSLAGTVTSLVALATAGMLVLIMLRCVEWTRDYQKTNYDSRGRKISTPHQRLFP
jgi:hypothetical protein